MQHNKVDICGVNTSKLPVLKSDQKKALFDRILKGDEDAREEYIFGNLRLVLSIIQRFNNRGEYADDIFQVGCIGLIKAIDNFDISHGVQFSTYAVPIGVIRCNNSKEDTNMTRKQALHKALEAVELLSVELVSKADKDKIKLKIEEIINDMPLTGWNEGAIFDSIDQFILDNGRIPTVADFKKKVLPPHPVIKLRFNMTLREFLDKHYPIQKLCSSKIYFNQTKEHWKGLFLSDYHNNKPCSAEEHNAKRTIGSPSWQTIAKMFGVSKWVDWLNYCEITPYANKREYKRNTVSTPPITVKSILTYTGEDGFTLRVTKDEKGAPVFL